MNLSFPDIRKSLSLMDKDHVQQKVQRVQVSTLRRYQVTMETNMF